MKKWLCFLLALGFSFTNVYADDDDEWEYEEEESPKKKAAPKKAKKSGDGSESKIGLSVSFGGQSNIAFVYNMGDLELGLGIDLKREVSTPVNPPNSDEQVNLIYSIVPSVHYELGKGLLNYGLGAWLSYDSNTQGDADPITGIKGFPNFYVSAEWIKNVTLRANAGILVEMPGDTANQTWQMVISFATSVGIIFYFM